MSICIKRDRIVRTDKIPQSDIEMKFETTLRPIQREDRN